VPAAPAWGYRLTQGIHVTTGIASIPLLLVKLWTVYPQLFAWPPVRSVVHAAERLSVFVLVAASLTEVSIGFVNVLQWYPWHFGFVYVHRMLAYVVIGALLLHIAVKLPLIREGLGARVTAAPTAAPAVGLSRRGLLIATAAGVGTLVVTTVGQSLGPLRRVALLAPRRPTAGPQGLAVNRTAAEAGLRDIAAMTGWRMRVHGPRPFALDLAAFEALPAVDRSIPLACVEGWSAGADWRGPLLLDLVRRAGGDADSRVRVVSLERFGSYRASIVDGPQLARAVLATHLNGERLDPDHGYPVRLIAPDRAGVLNTKWLTTVEVL
jgi:DMSO/TMAO reductase YedYZ molybdopterin-dependent catalytic subunit